MEDQKKKTVRQVILAVVLVVAAVSAKIALKSYFRSRNDAAAQQAEIDRSARDAIHQSVQNHMKNTPPSGSSTP